MAKRWRLVSALFLFLPCAAAAQAPGVPELVERFNGREVWDPIWRWKSISPPDRPVWYWYDVSADYLDETGHHYDSYGPFEDEMEILVPPVVPVGAYVMFRVGAKSRWGSSSLTLDWAIIGPPPPADPPKLSSRYNGQSVSTATPAWSWTGWTRYPRRGGIETSGNAHLYEVRLTGPVAIETRVESPGFQPSAPLPNGTYVMKVRSVVNYPWYKSRILPVYSPWVEDTVTINYPIQPPQLINPFSGKEGSAVPTWEWRPNPLGVQPRSYFIQRSWKSGEVQVPGTSWKPDEPLPVGLNTISLWAESDGVRSEKVEDRIQVPPYPPRPELLACFRSEDGSTADRRPTWTWRPAAGSQGVSSYTVSTEGPGGTRSETQLSPSETVWRSPVDLPPGLHTFSVRAHNTAGAGEAATDQVSVVLQKVTLELAETVTVASEKDGAARTALVRLVTGGRTLGAVRVRCRYEGGTAAAGQDFDGTEAVLDFPAGTPDKATAACPIRILQDQAVEPPERFTVVLASPEGGQLGGSVRHEVVVVDDDLTLADYGTDGVSVSPGVKSTTERQGPEKSATFTVTLKSPPRSEVRVSLVSTDTSEGTVEPEELVFKAGEITKPFTVTGQDDRELDGSVKYRIRTFVQSEDPLYARADPFDPVLTNEDDEILAYIVEPSSGLTVREGDLVPGKLKVSLTGPPPATLTSIPVISSSPSRVKVPGTLPVSASSWSNLEVPVSVEPDSRADLPVSATVTVGEGVVGTTAVPVSVRVLDDDPLLLTLSPDVAAEITLDEETSKTYTIGLTGPAPGALTLKATSSDPRVTATLGKTTVEAPDWTTGVSLTVATKGNTVDEADVSVVVTLEATGQGAPPARILRFLRKDDDLLALVVEPSSGLTVREGDSVPGKLKVSLTGPPPTGLTSIPVISSSPSRVKVPATLPVSASSWSNLEVPVTIEPDSRADLPASATVTVGQGVAGMTAVSVSVRVLDDDPLLLTLSPEVTAETTLAEETSKTYTLGLTGAAPGALTLKATSSDPRVTATLGKTTVTATEWTAGVSLTIATAGNTVDEADVSLLVTVEAEGSGAPPARILRFLRKDDDLPAYGVEPASGLTVREEDSVPARLKVSLTSPPPAGLTSIPVISSSGRVKVPGTLPVSASSWKDLDIPVSVEPDSRADQPVSATITVGQKADGTRAVAGMVPVSVNVRVLDDDVPGISFNPSTLRLDEPGGSRVFTVRLASRSAFAVSIPLNPEPPGRFRLSENPVVFPAGTLEKDVEVTVEDDSDVDGLETVRIWLDPAESGDGSYAGRNPAGPLYVEVISADNDVADQPPPAPPLFTLSPGVAGEILLDEGTSKIYTIGLTGPAWGALTLKATSSDPRVTATLGKTSVAPANWAAGVSLTVATAGNVVDEADASVLVALEAEGPGAPPARILRFLRKDDDLPALVVEPSSGLTVREGDTVPGKLKVSLTGPPPASLTSIPVVSNSSRVKVPATLPVSASSWSNLEVPVTVEPDSRADLPASATITVGQGVAGMTAVSVSVRVLDDDPLLFTLSPDAAGEISLDEESSKTYTIFLTGPAPGALTLKASSSDPRVTATLGQTSMAPADWTAGVSLTVVAAGNTVDEADVSVLVTLEAEGSGAPPARILRFLRKDDDLLALVVEPSSGLTVREGDTVPGKLKVSLTGPPPASLTSIPVVSNSSRVKVPATLPVSASSWSNLEVPVTVESDSRADLPASATITVGQGVAGMTAVSVSVRVLDDDPLLFTLSPDAVGEISLDEETSKTYTIGLTGPAPGTLTLKATSSDPRVTATLGNTSVALADWASGVSLTIATAGNTVDEADVSVLVVLEAVGAGAPPSRVLSFLRRDDDPPVLPDPGVTVEPTEGVVAFRSASPGVFQVRLRSRPTADVTLPLSLSRPDQARLSAESLVFTPESWDVVQEVRVNGRHQPGDDPPTVYTVVVGAAVSSDKRYSQLDPPDVRVTSLEFFDYEVTPVTGLTTTEGGGVARFNVAVPVQPRADLRIPLTVSDPDEATVAPRELVFTPRDWDIPRTVQVTGVDDDEVDGPQTVSVQVGPIQTEEPGMNGWELPPVEVVNLDDDTGGDFFTLPPCRLLDTHNEGGPLKRGDLRTLVIQGRCGIPQGARAVAFNVTAVQATADGWIELFPGDLAAPPGTRVVSFQPATNRACQAVLALSADGAGTLAVRPEIPADGTVHLLLDVVGWFN